MAASALASGLSGAGFPVKRRGNIQEILWCSLGLGVTLGSEKTLRLGDTVRVAVNERDGRCVMTTLDPAGAGESAPAVLRAIAEANQANAGVYGVVLTAGVVRPGDRITVED